MRHACLVFALFISLSALAQEGVPTAAQIRQAIAGEIQAFQIKPQPVHRVENRALWTGKDSLKIRLYYPNAGKKQRLILQIHGGALVAGDLDTHDNISRVLANRTQSVVIALDYRKPPEAPFPAGLQDCNFLLGWIKAQASTFNGNANDIILVGDSGGGLLATALLIQLQKQRAIKVLVLINPANDLRNPGEGLYGLVTQWYLGGQSPAESLVSPITARNFSNFPRTLVITSEKDELKSQGTALAAKLSQARVSTQLVEIANQDHLGGLWAAAHPTAQKAIEETVTFIGKISKP